MTAPAILGTPTVATATNSVINAAKPSGTTVGETLVLIVNFRRDVIELPGSLIGPTGFTLRLEQVNTTGHFVSTYLFDRVVDGSEAASFTSTFANAGKLSAVCMRLTAGAAFHLGTSNHGDSSNPTIPAVTTTATDTLVLLNANRSGSFTYTISGYTLGAQYESNVSAWYQKTLSAAGSTGAVAFPQPNGHVALEVAAYEIPSAPPPNPDPVVVLGGSFLGSAQRTVLGLFIGETQPQGGSDGYIPSSCSNLCAGHHRCRRHQRRHHGPRVRCRVACRPGPAD
jgi:hypothetical protein